jgi:hypothetical protein
VIVYLAALYHAVKLLDCERAFALLFPEPVSIVHCRNARIIRDLGSENQIDAAVILARADFVSVL